MTAHVRFEPGFKKTVKWTLFTAGGLIVLIGALGALSYAFPSITLPTVMGVGLLVSGLNYLVPYFALKNFPVRPKWFMILGIVDVVFGILFAARIWLVPFRFPTLAGIWMIFAACSRVFMAFENFRAKIGKWWITLVVSGYMLFAAAAMMANTTKDMSFPSWSAMIVSGVFIINEGRKLFGE